MAHYRSTLDQLLALIPRNEFQRIVILEAPSVSSQDPSQTPPGVRFLTGQLEPLLAPRSLDAKAVAYSIYGTLQAMAQFISRAEDPESARREAQEILRRLLQGISA